MRLIITILLLLVLYIQGISQPLQPKYIGGLTWKKVPDQRQPDILPVTTSTYQVKKTVTLDHAKGIHQRKANPKTRLIHIGRTQPIVQTIRVSSKKLSAPETIAAPPLLTRDNAEFNISYTDKQHGFAGGNTLDFAEDADHNIWIASDAGLIRYDGYHYFLYSEKNGMPNLPLTSIAYEKHKNRLWLAYESGMYYIRNDSLFSFRSEEIDFSNIPVNKVQVDTSSQKVWVSTKKNGAVSIGESSIEVFDKRCGLPDNYILSVYQDKNKRLFLATYRSGIVMIAADKALKFFSEPESGSEAIFLSFFEDEDGIWAGSFLTGLIRMGTTDTVQYSVSGNFKDRIYDIKKARGGGFWFSIYGHSLCYFNKKKLLIIDESTGLINQAVFMLFEDSFQNIWVSNLASGFSRINENAFYIQGYKNPAIGSIKAILPDHKKGNWIITEGYNLAYRTEGAAVTYTKMIKKENIFQYSLDGILNEDGTLWMGSYGAGIVHVKDATFTLYNYSDFIDYGIIQSIKRDAGNQVWFCPTSFGLIKYDNKRFWHYTVQSGLLSNLANRLYLDADKKIHWSFINGFQRLSDQGIETLFIGNKQLKDQVNSMLPLDDKITLLATNNNGLLIVNNRRVYQLTTDNGLSSNRVKTIIRDGYGKIWISTDKAIEFFSIKDSSFTAHSVFNQANGSYIVNISDVFLDTAGNPYWSMGRKKLVFDPGFVRDQIKSPVFSISQVMVNDNIQFPHSRISILPNQKINIDYTAIYWGRENNLEMKYLLISNRGDTSIYSANNNGNITISEVLPGNYHIVLKAQDNNQVYYSSPIPVRINEFWYNTWLFRILFACLVIGAIISYYRWKANFQKKINTQLTIKVAEQTDEILKEKEELQKSYTVIDKQNREKGSLIQEINHRVKNNLQLIASMVEMQMNNPQSKDTLLALLSTTRRIRAMSLVHELLYAKKDVQGLSSSQYINELVNNMKEMANDDVRPIHFRINVEDIYIDSRAALSIGMIISELVSNSFKYAFKNIASPEITIRFTENPTTSILQLLVADNGNGVTGDYDSKKSLGSRLIDIFSRQLESSYTIDHKDHFIFKLHFKPISS